MSQKKLIIEYTTRELGSLSRIATEIAHQKTANMRTQTAEEYRHSQQILSEVRTLPISIGINQELIAGVQCEWVHRRIFKNEERIIIYLHGGSWMFGNLDSARPVAALLVKETNFKVLMVEYSRAPEHPYPQGFNDCYKVYNYLIENGFDPSKIGIFGDSAGGNYSLALINQLKAEGKPLPACVGLASPVTDMRDNSVLFSSDNDLIYTKYNGKDCTIFKVYLGDAYYNQRDLPTISPITADLLGLPPMLIHAGGAEPIALDNIAYGEKMAAAAGEIRVKIWKDMFHDFTIVGASLRESRESLKEMGLFFRTHVGSNELSLR